jgi:hypothetical protein
MPGGDQPFKPVDLYRIYLNMEFPKKLKTDFFCQSPLNPYFGKESFLKFRSQIEDDPGDHPGASASDDENNKNPLPL